MTNTPGDPYPPPPPHESQQPGYWEQQAQHGYQQPPPGYAPPPFPQPPYPSAYGYMPPPNHPNATAAMVLGIVSLASIAVACGIGLLIAPVAWILGGKAVREIDRNPGAYSGRSQAKAGQVMGIVGTVLLVISLALIAIFIGFATSGAFDEPAVYDNAQAAPTL
jgi:hypothetical protein